MGTRAAFLLSPEHEMPHTATDPPYALRRPSSAGRSAHQPPRLRAWAGLTDTEILARYRPGQADPLQVLEVLIRLHNHQHTSLQKTVSHKTRQERADFLRHFYDGLHSLGFKTLPDPRRLAQKHIAATVRRWRNDKLKPPTIQTYLSFLRGLAMWTRKPGFVREPAFYGLELAEYQRHEVAERDKSWSAQGVNIEAVIAQVAAFDPYVGASLRLIHAFGLRKKEAIMLRPNSCVVGFEATGLPPEEHSCNDYYVHISQGAKNGRPRFLPLDTPQRREALALAQSVVGNDGQAHLGDPAHSLKHNMKRFESVLRKFGLTKQALGVTAHGLRHEALIAEYVARTGQQPPVRGGVRDGRAGLKDACLAVSKMAGHARPRASRAYLGAVMFREKEQKAETDEGSAQ
jgi:integrase